MSTGTPPHLPWVAALLIRRIADSKSQLSSILNRARQRGESPTVNFRLGGCFRGDTRPADAATFMLRSALWSFDANRGVQTHELCPHSRERSLMVFHGSLPSLLRTQIATGGIGRLDWKFAQLEKCPPNGSVPPVAKLSCFCRLIHRRYFVSSAPTQRFRISLLPPSTSLDISLR